MKTRGTGPQAGAHRPAAQPAEVEPGHGAAASTGGERACLQSFIDRSPRMLTQQHAIHSAFGPALQRQAGGGEVNKTGMPDRLKTGIEALSGMDMGAVRVHRGSAKPAQLNASAYAQGDDIHLAPGQERHLPHEAWHVVQQRQGRVPATTQLRGVLINDDSGLEREADVMGQQALQIKDNECATSAPLAARGEAVAQRRVVYEGEGAELLPQLVATFSKRADLFVSALEDKGLYVYVHLDNSKTQDEKNLNVVGETRGLIQVKNGARASYVLDSIPGKPEKSLGAAVQNKDYLKMTSMVISMKVNSAPFMRWEDKDRGTVSENVALDFEHQMVTFAHEWELHVAPMLELYQWVRTQQTIVKQTGQTNPKLEQQQLAPLFALLQGGESAEHKDDTNLAYFFDVLQGGKTSLGDEKAEFRVALAEAQQMRNLGITAEARNELLASLKSQQEK